MWYIDNKYSRTYFRLIESRRRLTRNCYLEEHHVLPEALGGSDDSVNLVKLTGREHFICHLLLPKMLDDKKARHKMLCALRALISAWRKHEAWRGKTSVRMFSRAYESWKIRVAKAIGESNRGKKRTPEQRETMRLAQLKKYKDGYSMSTESRLRLREARVGVKLSEAHCKNIAEMVEVELQTMLLS